ncbi:MAG: peptidylprolyl isomerase [Firmicutes bacterium]|nr:peptidylprolyl isomerase [Bacillota bacterium]
MRLAFLAPLLALSLFATEPAKPQVKFTTTLGSFTVELEPEAAPKTVANFLRYVRSGHYKGTTFHRVISKFMIQGGGVTAKGTEKPAPQKVENEAKLAFEKGLKNVRGSLAMARTNDPHSASAQFFVNVVDNAFLDYPGRDGWGYCVFGKVIEGMDTVDAIRNVQTGPSDKPVKTVEITSAVVIGDKAPARKAPRKK